MAWETRTRGGQYYTRSRRVNGRVVREYVGGGDEGQLCAERDAQARSQRKTDKHGWRTERAQLKAIDTELAAYCAQVNEAVRQALTAAGYHQHKRGEWRRKRDSTNQDNRQE